MTKNKLLTYTFIADFRGGKYCTQVQAENVNKSLVSWTKKLKKEKKQVQYLGDKVIKELENEIKDKDNLPTLLTGLKNIWCTLYSTSQGSFTLNIVQTDTE